MGACGWIRCWKEPLPGESADSRRIGTGVFSILLGKKTFGTLFNWE